MCRCKVFRTTHTYPSIHSLLIRPKTIVCGVFYLPSSANNLKVRLVSRDSFFFPSFFQGCVCGGRGADDKAYGLFQDQIGLTVQYWCNLCF